MRDNELVVFQVVAGVFCFAEPPESWRSMYAPRSATLGGAWRALVRELHSPIRDCDTVATSRTDEERKWAAL